MAEENKITLPESQEEPKDEKAKQEKTKNLIAALILVGGLLVGSLFVDLSQLIKGSGFSQKNLRQTDVFSADGKTWVAYSEPVVTVKIITDEKCAECDPAEALVWLRRVSPTISAQKINFDSAEGKELLQKFSLKTLPVFLFSENVVKTEFYAQAQSIFTPKEKMFVLKTQELGLAPGRYLETPEIKADGAVFGQADAKVKVILFSDFECPYCKALYQALRGLMNQYAEKVIFVHKDFPLDFHAKAKEASLAALCALEQGKFWEFGDRLFANQANWQNSGAPRFKVYAQNLGLKSNQFNECLDSQKYQKQIEVDMAEAESFGITGTPAIFINDKFINGVVSAEDLKKYIDEALAK
jgi:protein-disulfide isomerase